MKVMKIKGTDYALKFNTEVITQLHAKGITLLELTKDMESLKLDRLYETFFYGLKAMLHDITMNEVYKIIDNYFEEDGDIEQFFKIVLEEYASAMGLGKKFKEVMDQQAKIAITNP